MPRNSLRALLITPTSPWGVSFGARQRTALLYEALVEELPVDILWLDEGSRNEAAPGDRPEILAKLTWKQPALTLYRYGVHAWANSWCHSNIDWMKYALVVSRYLTPMTKIEWPLHLRTIVDCDDAYYRYAPAGDSAAARGAALARGWMRLWQTKVAIRKYDHAFFCTQRDGRRFRPRSSSILPNVVRAPAEPPATLQRSAGTALIVGSMWYRPNQQGVDWFLERCWPAVADRCPDLSLRIVGPAPFAHRERWARAVRTESPGFVEDIGAEYARALFVVAPIHAGGGMPIKFLESSAFCRACVVTRHVFAAFDADFHDGDSVLVAGDAKRMVEACVMLFEDAQRRDTMARRAHEIVASRFTVQRFNDTVRDAVRRTMSSAATRA